jgi:hypothetical protein
MKVKIRNEEVAAIVYPCLMQSESGTIALFKEARVGIRLSGLPLKFLGEEIRPDSMAEGHVFMGEITLSNTGDI